MDKVKIIGIQDVSFSGQDGNQVTGVTYYYTREDEKIKGFAAGKYFISTDKVSRFSVQPKLGDEVCVIYNRYGKVDDFQALKPAGK